MMKNEIEVDVRASELCLKVTELMIQEPFDPNPDSETQALWLSNVTQAFWLLMKHMFTNHKDELFTMTRLPPKEPETTT